MEVMLTTSPIPIGESTYLREVDSWSLDRWLASNASLGIVHILLPRQLIQQALTVLRQHLQSRELQSRSTTWMLLPARGVENGDPVDPTAYFTSSDDSVYAWRIWEGSSGSHSNSFVWYRPGGILHYDYSYDFDYN